MWLYEYIFPHYITLELSKVVRVKMISSHTPVFVVNLMQRLCHASRLHNPPSAYFWTQYTGGEGTCINPKVTVDAFYAYSAVSCVGDWTLGILPAFMVWNLQMNFRTKLSVAAILAVGCM